MRLMLDTNVLVRAALSPRGAASELLRLVAENHILVTSSFQLAELLEVLRRPIIRSLHGLDEHGIRRFVTRMYKLAAVAPLPAEVPNVVPHDPKDNPIVLTALTGQADVLCTLDRHLHQEAVQTYCAERGTRILTDVEVLRELRAGGETNA